MINKRLGNVTTRFRKPFSLTRGGTIRKLLVPPLVKLKGHLISRRDLFLRSIHSLRTLQFVALSKSCRETPLTKRSLEPILSVGTHGQVPGLRGHPAGNSELTCFGQGSGNSGLCASIEHARGDSRLVARPFAVSWDSHDPHVPFG